MKYFICDQIWLVDMSEVFRVYILNSNFHTCFFYLNNSDIKHDDHKRAIQIRYGPDHQKFSYGCISSTPVLEVPSKFIGVASLFANTLGLKENETILVSHCDVQSIDCLQILPKKEEDYVILVSCKSILEAYLLDQVSVVAEGQVLPLYVFSNISILIEIDKLNLACGYGRLEKFTELTVLHPSERPKTLKTEIQSKEITEIKKNLSEHMFDQFSNILKNNSNKNQISKQRNSELILKHLVENHSPQVTNYKIQPSFLLFHDVPKKIQNRYVIVSHLRNKENPFGCCSVKIFAKVQKVINKLEEKYEMPVAENRKEISFLYTYVISTNNDSSNFAFCPPHVMKKLKLFAGSAITIEEVKPNSQIEFSRRSEILENDNEFSDCFWESIFSIRKNIRQVIINNFRYNYKINSLVVGESGTGKSFLLTNILNEFKNKFVFCKMVHCKSLRGKKIETLHKLLTDNMRECSKQEPSLFVLDDLHALTYIDEEESQFNKLYSNRVVDLIVDILEDFQQRYNISVIASSASMSQLSSLTSQHGPRLFENVLIIPQMNFNERAFALNNIVKFKVGVFRDCSLDLDEVSGRANGYTIQDLNDLVDKAIFNSLLRNEAETNVCQIDFESALLESTPLSLRNVKLKQNIETKWENVGGMMEPKKILTEVFSWPLKYPKILESCPLRLQRGVLLYGAPGTGKTLLAGAVANKCGFNFISVKGPEVLSKYVGASEEGVRNLFIQAQKTQPCLLFFDEFDSLAPKRGHDNTGVTDRVVNQLLTQLDGVESLTGVWVLAATSRPDLLDSALLRPGRLDKMVFCDLPNQADRLSILEVLSKNLPKGEDVNFLEIAKKTEGYTGADLLAVLYNAQMLTIKEEKTLLEKKLDIKIKQMHMLNAVSEVKPSLSVWEKERYRKIYEKFLNSRKRDFINNYEGTQRVTLA